MISVIKAAVPTPARPWLRGLQNRFSGNPSHGLVRFGSLRRLSPICDEFGFSRGRPIDRYYIEQFLLEYATDIKGRVLEIAENYYTAKFGGDRVSRSDVLYPLEEHTEATIIADLTGAEQIPDNIFDCIILTQTLPFIYDIRAALKTLYRILKPGGVLLTTNPGIDRVHVESMQLWGQYWRFTDLSVRRLLEDSFLSQNIKMKTYGNVLTATAFLQGIAAEELNNAELDHHDPNYQVLIASRSVKSLGGAGLAGHNDSFVRGDGRAFEQGFLKERSANLIAPFLTDQYGLHLINPPTLMRGGMESVVWSVQSNQGSWVLKIFGTHQGSFERIQEEVLLYEYLNRNGLRAPHVLLTRQGGYVAKLCVEGTTFCAFLMRFEELRECHAANIKEDEMLEIARTQARMHDVLRRYSDNENFARVTRYRPTGRAFSKLLESPYAPMLSAEELAELKMIDRKMFDYASRFKQDNSLTESTLHGDMRLEHAQFLPDGRVYLFDFADRSRGLVAYGLAVMLSHLYCDDKITFARWEELRTWLLKGYTSICELSEEDQAAIKPLLVIRLLEEVAYLSERARVAVDLVDAEGLKRRYKLADCILKDFQAPPKQKESHLRAITKPVKNLIPQSARLWVRKQQRNFAVNPPVGWVRFGNLRRLEPIDQSLGFSRGQPVDRYYIERFLSEHRDDIKGQVLEIGDATYTRKFGGDQVSQSFVLNVMGTGSKNEIVADLQSADHLQGEMYDCIICAQTLPCIYDLEASVRTLHRLLKPGGILLATNPGCAPIHAETMRVWGQYWRFTSLAIRRLLETRFTPQNIAIKTYGNVLVATAFVQGIAAGELSRKELDYHDPNFEVSIVSRSLK